MDVFFRFISGIIIICSILFVSCNNREKADGEKRPVANNNLIKYRIVDSLPHDTTSFTEGFLIHHGYLFESTGYAESYPSSRSLFGKIDKTSGTIQVKAEIDKKKYFGEGIVFLNNKIYQLTYTTKIGFIYDANTFKNLGNFHYDGEGWGLTTNGSNLIMTDGSSRIRYLDPNTFKIVKVLNVFDDQSFVSNVNEPELINGFIYANQWLTNYLLKIDTSSGKVVGKLDLSELKFRALAKYPYAAETNGIAYDSVRNKIYVTGKLWPNIYEIAFDH